MRRAILVNGVPASGKSTLARAIVAHLGARGIAAVPLSLDTVKEGLYAHLGTGGRAFNRTLGRASYHAIFASIAGFPDDLVPVIDAWHGFQPVSVLEEHLGRARIARVLEVWCAVPPEVAAARYRARAGERHGGHPPASYADELLELARRAGPFALGDVLTLDGTAPAAIGDLERIAAFLEPPAPSGK